MRVARFGINKSVAYKYYHQPLSSSSSTSEYEATHCHYNCYDFRMFLFLFLKQKQKDNRSSFKNRMKQCVPTRLPSFVVCFYFTIREWRKRGENDPVIVCENWNFWNKRPFSCLGGYYWRELVTMTVKKKIKIKIEEHMLKWM